MRQILKLFTICVISNFYSAAIALASVEDITQYGAVGDGNTISTKAIQQAIDAAHAKGGRVVKVPAGGVFLCGSIFLKTNIEL